MLYPRKVDLRLLHLSPRHSIRVFDAGAVFRSDRLNVGPDVRRFAEWAALTVIVESICRAIASGQSIESSLIQPIFFQIVSASKPSAVSFVEVFHKSSLVRTEH
jgi:hypothetical protein